jgi:hypothetical protein
MAFSEQFFPLLNRPRVRVFNQSGKSIPAGGVMRIVDSLFYLNRVVVVVDRPNDSFERLYLVNCGPEIYKTDGYGWGASLGEPGLVLYDGDEPQQGQSWGAVPDSWLLGKDRPGFLICGGTQPLGGEDATIARQSLVEQAIGMPTALIPFLTLGTIDILSGPYGENSSGQQLRNVLNASRDIPTAEPVRVMWFNGTPFLFPFYQQITLVVKPIADIPKGTSGQCLVYQAGASTGTQVTCLALGARVTYDKWCVAWQEAASGQWYVGPWECA